MMKPLSKFIAALTVFLFVFSGPLSTLPALAAGETYTVTFNPQSGTLQPGDTTKDVTAGGIYGELPKPELAGYLFLGWFTDPESGDEIISTSTVTISDNQTLYAHWSEIIYAIHYHLDSGVNDGSNPNYYNVDYPDIHLAAPTKDDYTFNGWTCDALGITVPTVDAVIPHGSTLEVDFTAHWTATDYTITYNLDNGVNDAANPATYTIESPDIHIANPTKNGYTFDGWTSYSNGIDTPEKSVTIPGGSDTNIDLTAHWTINDYTITYNLDSGTNNASNPATYTVADAEISVAAPTKDGYTFVGWTSSELGITSPAKDVKIPHGTFKDVTLTAHWTAEPYTITYHLDSGVNASTNPSAYSITSADIQLTAPTKAGYTFAGWTGTGIMGDPLPSVTIPAGSKDNREYTAHWTLISYTISYNLDSGTNDASNPASYTVESAAIHLAAPTKADFVFAGWTGTGITGDPVPTVTISAKSTGNLEYTAHWTAAVKTTGITLAGPTKIGIGKDFARTVTATIIPTDATIKTVNWSSSDTSIATVSSTGLVTGLKAGTVTITATATDGSGKSGTLSITVTTDVLVQQIVISGTHEIAQKKSTQLTAAVTPANAANKKVVWSSSVPSVATVSKTGKVTAGKLAGTTIIKAASSDGSVIEGTFTVTVMPHAATSVVVTGTNVIDLAASDKTTQLTASVKPADASQLVAWTSSSKKIATVDATGKVTGLKAGTVTITATAQDGSARKGKLKVTVTTLAKSITVSGPTEVATGKKIQLAASVSPDTTANKKVTWSSSNPLAASVSKTGLVTAKAVTADTPVTITATSADAGHVKADYAITVKAAASAQVHIVFDGKSANGLPFGVLLTASDKTMQFSAQVLPAGASQNVIWSSSNKKVATVTKDGLVTGVGSGTATITATAADGSGKKATITFSVGKKFVQSVVITGPLTNGALGSILKPGRSLQIKYTVSPSDATNKKLVWISSDPTVATVSSTGKVTAKKVKAETAVVIYAFPADGSWVTNDSEDAGGVYLIIVEP